MWTESEIEFQLKLHSLDSILTTKEREIQILETKINSLGSTKIQSQDQILQLIASVHSTIKNVQRIIGEVKEPCYELKLNNFYELFKGICCLLVNAIKLLAQGYENGVERNLLKFKVEMNEKEQSETLGLLEQNDELLKSEELMRLEKNQELYSEMRSQIEIDRIYQSLFSQKESVLKTTASNAVIKLNEVKMNWMKMINDSDEMLEEAYYRKNEGNKDFVEKIQKPEYISKVLKQELSKSIQGYFKEYIEKSLKRMHQRFYSKQYKKMKEQIERQKPPTQSTSQQTDIEGLNKVRTVIRERKNVDKLSRQLQEVKKEKQQVVQEYLKTSRANDIYSSRIEELERKIVRMNSMDKKVQGELSRVSIRNSRRGSISEARSKHQEVNDPGMQNAKINNLNRSVLKTEGEQILERYKNFEESPQMMEIIKKKNKFQKVYPKSRMHTEQEMPRKLKEEDLNQRKETLVETEKALPLEKVPSLKLEKSYEDSSNGKMKSQESLKMIEHSLKLIKQEQCKNAMVSILELVQKMKSNNSQADKKEEVNINQSQNNRESNGSEALAQRAMSNPEICSLFTNFIKRIVSTTIINMEEIKNQPEKKRPAFKRETQRHSGVKSKEEGLLKNENHTQNVLTNNLLVKLLDQKAHENKLESQKLLQNPKTSKKIYEIVQKQEPKTKLISDFFLINEASGKRQFSDRFDKLFIGQQRNLTSESKARSSIMAATLNFKTIKPLLKAGKRNNTQLPNHMACSSKLISIQQMKPKRYLNNDQIIKNILEIYKSHGHSMDELQISLSSYIELALRRLFNQRKLTTRDHYDTKYRISKLETSYA